MKRSILIILLSVFSFDSYGQSTHQALFDKFSVSGSTTIYDYKNRKWIYTDSVDANKETLPASTFKILNSLIALETKAVKDENEIVKWDGTERDFFGAKMDVWNKDTDLKTAYRNSTIWFYVEMAKRVGRNKYKKYLKECGYGNLNFSEKGTDFWNLGEHGITPKNQIEFLVKLYENNLPFSKPVLNKVKEIMISEQTKDFTFRDKTGWTKQQGIDIGWWVGYVQTDDNVFFFATRITKNTNLGNPSFGKARKEITKEILKNINAI